MGLAPHLTKIKIWDKTETKKSIFPSTTIRKTSGPSNLIDTRTGDRQIVTKNRQKRMRRVIFAS